MPRVAVTRCRSRVTPSPRTRSSSRARGVSQRRLTRWSAGSDSRRTNPPRSSPRTIVVIEDLAIPASWPTSLIGRPSRSKRGHRTWQVVGVTSGKPACLHVSTSRSRQRWAPSARRFPRWTRSPFIAYLYDIELLPVKRFFGRTFVPRALQRVHDRDVGVGHRHRPVLLEGRPPRPPDRAGVSNGLAQVSVEGDPAVRIGVADGHGELSHPHHDAGLLLDFTRERRGVIFAGTDLPARELPRPGERGVARARLDQHAPAVVDDRSEHDLRY